MIFNAPPQRVDLSSDDYTKRFKEAKVYIKSAVVQATRARGGERIETVLADGTAETVNTCNEGDFIVTNPGGERYVLAPENFAKRYESMEDGSYRAKGMCRAFPNPTGDDVSVTAPWGEEQHGGWDAMFAVAVDQARRQTTSFRAGKDRRIPTSNVQYQSSMSDPHPII